MMELLLALNNKAMITELMSWVVVSTDDSLHCTVCGETFMPPELSTIGKGLAFIHFARLHHDIVDICALKVC